MYRTASHAGHFLYNPPCLDGTLLPGSPTAYLLSKPLNRLEFAPSYPQNSKTLGDYIRKWRMEQGISQVELAERLGVTGDTVINWEIRGMMPAKRHLERLRRVIPGLAAITRDSYEKTAG